VGVDRLTPLLDGRQVPYVNLDNAASTPPLADALRAVCDLAEFYSSVHRGSGFKSRLSTEAYEWARQVIASFVGADERSHTVVFGKNTTEAINKLSYRLPLGADRVVISTELEHHSNDLPWRPRATVVHARCLSDGRLDEDDVDRLLARHAGRVALVAVTGAANVTGYIQPIHALARKAHAAGARILVDAAQLAPHRRIDMRPDGDPEHLDFVALAGHKMYAPFGTGALVAPRDVFQGTAPEYTGGGTVDSVTLDEVDWAEPPEREEAGSPNVLGAVAMAVAARTLRDMGMDAVAEHESQLLRYALERLTAVPRLRVYGESDPDLACRDKVGVVPFNLDGVPHALVAAVLGYEWGVGVRNGCFCAHPYVIRLLGVDSDASGAWRRRVRAGDRSELPGMVRMSLGCYSEPQDVDRLVAGLEAISRGEVRGRYKVDQASGEYRPVDHRERAADFLPWLSDDGGLA
jgi:selenocysteine lyase/cysteine desulfurase